MGKNMAIQNQRVKYADNILNKEKVITGKAIEDLVNDASLYKLTVTNEQMQDFWETGNLDISELISSDIAKYNGVLLVIWHEEDDYYEYEVLTNAKRYIDGTYAELKYDRVLFSDNGVYQGTRLDVKIDEGGVDATLSDVKRSAAIVEVYEVELTFNVNSEAVQGFTPIRLSLDYYTFSKTKPTNLSEIIVSLNQFITLVERSYIRRQADTSDTRVYMMNYYEGNETSCRLEFTTVKNGVYTLDSLLLLKNADITITKNTIRPVVSR